MSIEALAPGPSDLRQALEDGLVRMLLNKGAVDEAAQLLARRMARVRERVGGRGNALAEPLLNDVLLLAGEEEYELLFSVRPGKAGKMEEAARRAGVKVTAVGRIVRGKGIVTVSREGERSPLRAEGWKHFQS